MPIGMVSWKYTTFMLTCLFSREESSSLITSIVTWRCWILSAWLSVHNLKCTWLLAWCESIWDYTCYNFELMHHNNQVLKEKEFRERLKRENPGSTPNASVLYPLIMANWGINSWGDMVSSQTRWTNYIMRSRVHPLWPQKKLLKECSMSHERTHNRVNLIVMIKTYKGIHNRVNIMVGWKWSTIETFPYVSMERSIVEWIPHHPN